MRDHLATVPDHIRCAAYDLHALGPEYLAEFMHDLQRQGYRWNIMKRTAEHIADCAMCDAQVRHPTPIRERVRLVWNAGEGGR